MNNLYHRVAVASVCTALSFTLGANKEAKAATFSLPSIITSEVIDYEATTISGNKVFNYDGLADELIPEIFTITVLKGTSGEVAQLTEFNISSFSFANTVISSAVLQVEISGLSVLSGFGYDDTNPGSLGIFGYIGNGTAELSDFEAGVFLNSVDTSFSSIGDILSFDVSSFINQRVSNGDAFAGFGIRALNFGGLGLNNGSPYSPRGIKLRLIVETADVAEPVPESATIFGSALALGVGGWLKRKKSSQRNKTTPQH
jgi:hypothetical protein